MLLGIVAATLCLLTAAKFITKRLPSRRADIFLMKSHRFTAAALSAVTVVHAALSWKLLGQRPAGMPVTGFLMVLCLALLLSGCAASKKPRAKRLFAHRAAAALMLALLAAHVLLGVTSFNAYQKAVASIAFEDIPVAEVADGTYEGDCDVGYIYAKVRATVAGGKILSADLLEHRNERGAAAEQITGKIVAKQSLDVDAVSGATNSSKVIRKAAENALSQGISR